MDPLTISSRWDATERTNGQATAVVCGHERLSYHQLGQQIRHLASSLQAHWHIAPGDIVALLAPNCTEFLVAYFALLKIGAIVQPVDERMTPEEIETVMSDSAARYLIVDGPLWSKTQRVRSQSSQPLSVLGIRLDQPGIERFEDWIVPMPAAADASGDVTVQPNDVAELMYTSGSSGQPKGVLRSHANALAAARNAVRGFGYHADEVILIVMPLSHSSALTSQMLPIVGLGGTLVLQDGFDVLAVVQAIRDQSVTCLRAVPAMLRLLLTQDSFCSAEMPTLRLILNSSAPIDAETITEIKRRFASVQVLNSYGLTEASTSTVLTDDALLEHPDSIGRAIEGVEMCVVDSQGQPVEDGTEGEICIRGDHLLVGYLHRPDATAAALRDGWLHTGDLGLRDADGFYYLLGRLQQLINCGGHKVAPLEVENCILQISEVAEVAVVAAPHRVLGQVAKAYVVAHNGATLDPKSITKHCTRQLPSHKVPFFVELLEALPKSGAGKILHHELVEAPS